MGLFGRLFGKEKPKPAVQKRTVMNLKIGDIVTYDLEDYQVVGKLSYNDHGFKWYAYQLQGSDRMRWLSVEMDDELELGIYEKADFPVQEPIPKKLNLGGVTYYLDESGTAIVHGEGRGQNVDGMSCRYFDFYDEDEEKYLSVEIWGSEVEVSTGRGIEAYELQIIAGSM